MKTYVREDDGAVMVEVAPHQFVNEELLARLGLTARGRRRRQ